MTRGYPLRENRRVSAPTVIPRAYREAQGRIVGGVAVGIAANLRWPVWTVRALFVIFTVFGGISVVAYAAYWAVLPNRQDDDSDTARLLAFGALVIGGFLLLPTNPWMQIGLPLAVMAIGATVVWTRVQPGRLPRGDGMQWTALLLGVLLVLVGIVGLAATGLGLRSLLSVTAVAILLLVGVGLIAMPWVAGLYRELTAERQERVRSQTRAELATQVHDSVLQTLTLIRKNADDPERVVRLARAEERHLRAWLYEPVGDPDLTLSAALAQVAARVEQDYPVTVEVVCVGEAELDERGQALMAATGEAVLNAAKHAGGTISLYAEADETTFVVYVRDRGPGFNESDVPADRRGIAESMRGRMHRVDGRCSIRTSDRGTEVTLTLPVAP